jgi:septum formation protein
LKTVEPKGSRGSNPLLSANQIMTKKTLPIILASKSPRRQEILAKLGLKFQIVSHNYVENLNSKLPPMELATILAKGKAASIASKYQNHLILAADTFIALKNELLGKPHTEITATKMLHKISGQCLSVITGFTILNTNTNQEISKAVKTKVYIKNLSTTEIKNYVQTKEPLDKAGAFAIQGLGAFMVKKINGDFYNVMGLPLFELTAALKKAERLQGRHKIFPLVKF